MTAIAVIFMYCLNIFIFEYVSTQISKILFFTQRMSGKIGLLIRVPQSQGGDVAATQVVRRAQASRYT
jgi:hypothetical protein